MATIRKRNHRYQVQIRLKGHPLVTETFTRKMDAERWAAKTETEILEGRFFPKAEAARHTFREVADRYRRTVMVRKSRQTRLTEESRLVWWEERLGDYSLDMITPALITQARDELQNQGTGYQTGRRVAAADGSLSKTTVGHYLRLLTVVFNIAVQEWQWLAANPAAKVKKPPENRGVVRYLSPDEIRRLKAACRGSGNPYLLAAVMVSISTGLRRNELLTLTWEQVDLQNGRIFLHETKNKQQRGLPLRGEALDLMRQLHASRSLVSDLCFPSFQDPRKPYDIRRPFTIALKKAGIENFRWHDLRHTCASYLVMNGASLIEVAEILGHNTLQMVKRYAHLSPDHLDRIVEKMNQSLTNLD